MEELPPIEETKKIEETPAIQPQFLDEFEKPSKPNWRLWIAAGGCVVLLCAVAFIGAIVFAGPKLVQQFMPQTVATAEELPRGVTNSNSMGDPNAPVHIVEYGDFQCPYCQRFWSETEPLLIEEYVNTGKVYFEYKSFPFLGPESVLAAEASYCAGDQNKFWEYHDTLYTNQTGENVGNFTQENLIKYAKTLGLNTDEFGSCLKNETYKGTVEQDKAEAEANGVHATPTFLLNGHRLEGAQPFSVFKDFIEKLLEGNIDSQSG